MKIVELKYSKSKIDKAGDILKKGTAISQEERDAALEVLSNWRAFHVAPLNAFAKVLKSRVRKVSNKEISIVAQRLKRTPSILLKLQTHKTMRLSAMQDIGGLRTILDGVKDVYSLADLYRKSKSKHRLAALDDYIANPKADGYRKLLYGYKSSNEILIFNYAR